MKKEIVMITEAEKRKEKKRKEKKRNEKKRKEILSFVDFFEEKICLYE
jgi:hypothetical protein